MWVVLASRANLGSIGEQVWTLLVGTRLPLALAHMKTLEGGLQRRTPSAFSVSPVRGQRLPRTRGPSPQDRAPDDPEQAQGLSIGGLSPQSQGTGPLLGNVSNQAPRRPQHRTSGPTERPFPLPGRLLPLFAHVGRTTTTYLEAETSDMIY